ncbi:AAA family ATPase [Yinghuangia sp. YIM S10712]|uniref:AAA family ATPase n=1 Tax=Yinghuangia sp. YIM S10712 TaxID=3436930 RepID=UPI003F539DCA
MLHGRAAERSAVESLLADAREGGISGVLVVRGEPGIGKTELLDHAVAGAAAQGVPVVRAASAEFEAELPYAGLSLLLRPALAHIGALPEPQRRALDAALGLASGAAPEPMFVGLAVLSLLSEYAGDGPLLCVVDDAQWLDRVSSDALVFAARRLHAEGIVMLFGARDDEGAFPAPGLTELRLAGLPPTEAGALLDAHAPNLAPSARFRVLAEARGNPLALLELPVALAENGGSTVFRPGALPLTSRLQLAFHGQVSRLPEATQTLLLLAALDDSGDLGVVLRAGARLGAAAPDLEPAHAAGLVRLNAPDATDSDAHGAAAPVFRHPLIRAAVHQRAPLDRRLAAHRALADALDSPDQADRRAWQLAAAASGPDDQAADALERTADRARERGGYAAAARAYEFAARLTTDRSERVRRLALAAQWASEAGDLDQARELAIRSASGAGDPEVRATLALVHGLADFWQGAFPSSHKTLVGGADEVAPHSPGHAARLLVEATHAAWYVGEHELDATLARFASLDLSDQDPVTPVSHYLVDCLYRGPRRFPTRPGTGSEARADPPRLAEVVAAVRAAGGVDARVLQLLCGIALTQGHDTDAHDLATELAADSRRQGGIGRLPTLLFYKAEAEVFDNRYADALATATEALAFARDTGQQQWVSQFHSVVALLRAVEGEEAACREAADAALGSSAGGAMAPGTPWTYWALGLLDLGLGRAGTALARLEQLTREPLRHHICASRSTPDLVEAAVRVGEPERVAEQFARFQAWAEWVRRPWADAVVLRCRALLAAGGSGNSADSKAVSPDNVEDLWTRSLTLHDPERRPMERARTALLYGEWLRRGRRKTDAREHLRYAWEEFTRLGAKPWAERARSELDATGTGTARPATASPTGAAAVLTPQELQITRLAAQGLSNRDIAAQLFLSPRTVGHHLYKAYPKLGIVSRNELAGIPDLLGA